MKYIADLHVHSPYSRATSKNNDVAGLFAWARVKGIHIVGTGDFTHPGWFAQLKNCLEPAEPGLFKLKDENVPLALAGIDPESIPVRFILSSEISCIYKKGDKTRKIHTILYVPDMASVEKINIKLASIGNIESDGRPILGLDARNLLEILLESSAEGFMVPAHIWTPWFSLFGSKSGFDRIEECFEDLTDNIFSLETGLSSDPEMNRLISALDGYTLISNSDCHSPSKLGREANLFDSDFNFFALRDSLKIAGSNGFLGTIEFYPEEGKYHYDGHRKCDVCFDPIETRAKNFLCPVCGKPLTVGVMHRVMEMADRKTPQYPNSQHYFESLVPLPEILGEILGVGSGSKKVMEQYRRIIYLFGSEFNLYRQVSIEEINHSYSEILGEAVRRLRNNEVIRKPGYDGEYGVIKVFDHNEMHQFTGQMSFIPDVPKVNKTKKALDRNRLQSVKNRNRTGVKQEKRAQDPNPEQISAIQSTKQRILVSAGPGTGKTFTLVSRITALLKKNSVLSNGFVVITFTNRAANELRERLEKELEQCVDAIFIGTFHRFCLEFLRKDTPELEVIGQEAKHSLLKHLFSDLKVKEIEKLSQAISDHYFNCLSQSQDFIDNPVFETQISAYQAALQQKKAIDIDAIIPELVQKIEKDFTFGQSLQESVTHLFIDEFQDLNHSQYRLIHFLADRSDVFAIGDPNQAIYGFRGSNPEHFHKFLNEFPVETFHLKINYRSVPSILNAASAVIANNEVREQPLTPIKEGNSMIEYHQLLSAKEEAEFVADKIDRLVGGIRHLSIHSANGKQDDFNSSYGFKNIAVLYRLSNLSKELAKALEKSGIPFQLIDSKPFFMSKALKPFYYCIRYAAESNVLDFIQFLKQIPGIGKRSLQQIEVYLYRQSDFNLNGLEDIKLPAKVHEILAQIKHQITQFRHFAPSVGVAEAVCDMMRYMKMDIELPDCIRFLELCGAFGKDLSGVSHHLHQNSLATVYDDRAEAVSLMTLHASKGLEFSVVIMVGLEEDIIPCNLPGLPSDTQEERRLFYVGQTRAQERLILTSVCKRTIFGVSRNQTFSRFLDEIPHSLIIRNSAKQPKAEKSTGEQLSF